MAAKRLSARGSPISVACYALIVRRIFICPRGMSIEGLVIVGPSALFAADPQGGLRLEGSDQAIVNWPQRFAGSVTDDRWRGDVTLLNRCSMILCASSLSRSTSRVVRAAKSSQLPP